MQEEGWRKAECAVTPIALSPPASLFLGKDLLRVLTEVFVNFIKGAGPKYLCFTPSAWLKVVVAC